MRLCRFCFGLVIYINIYITHVKILIYFTPENHFLSIGFFIFWTGLPPNRTGIPVRTDCTTRFEFKFAFARYPTGSRLNRIGKPVPDLASSVRSVGSVNPAPSNSSRAPMCLDGVAASRERGSWAAHAAPQRRCYLTS
jgi:hypothetical protein